MPSIRISENTKKHTHTYSLMATKMASKQQWVYNNQPKPWCSYDQCNIPAWLSLYLHHCRGHSIIRSTVLDGPHEMIYWAPIYPHLPMYPSHIRTLFLQSTLPIQAVIILNNHAFLSLYAFIHKENIKLILHAGFLCVSKMNVYSSVGFYLQSLFFFFSRFILSFLHQ